MSVFSAEVIEAVKRHMNDDRAEDNVLICRALGGQPYARGATMTSMNSAGIEFRTAVSEPVLAVGRNQRDRQDWEIPKLFATCDID